MYALEDTLEVGLGGLLHGSLDLLVRGGLLDAGGEVDDGDIGAKGIRRQR